jgi:putative membrane protein
MVDHFGWQRPTFWSLVLGVYFLTVWDLSLDPAMASDRLPIHFWSWFEPGPYFGMPVRNLIGWSVTGLIYMSVSRLLWRSPLDVRRIASWLPFVIYTANSCFAIILALSAGMWQPLLIALLLGLVPATLALLPASVSRGGNHTVVRRMSYLTVHQMGKNIARKDVISTVYGLEHIPQSGPVLIVARHFHHLYDGCILLKAIPRRLHILVALDWVRKRWLRSLMEQACGLVEWPMVLREESLNHAEQGKKSAYRANETIGYLRRAVMLTVKLLRQEEVLVIFPEAYPTIDPAFTLKEHSTTFLPFRPGFASLIKKAEQDRQTKVAIVPVGLNYAQNERWHVTLRFGQALFLQDFNDTRQLVQVVERRVQELSAPESATPSIQIQEVLRYETDSIS